MSKPEAIELALKGFEEKSKNSRNCISNNLISYQASKMRKIN